MKRIALFASLLVVGLGQVNAQSYTFIDLGSYIGAGSSVQSGANAINNSGQVVGYTYAPQFGFGNTQTMVWDRGVAIDIGATWGTNSNGYAINNAASPQIAGISSFSNSQTNNPNAVLWQVSSSSSWSSQTFFGTSEHPSVPASSFYGINDSMQVVGTYSDGTSTNAFSYGFHTGVMTNLTTLGGSDGTARAINNGGVIAGWSSTAGNASQHAVVWTGGDILDLGTLGGLSSAAYAINSAGHAVGRADLSNMSAYHATLWNGTNAIDLGTLNGSNSEALGINDSGQAVGWSDSVGGKHAALFADGKVVDLNSFLSLSDISAGWVLAQANGINDYGNIVGNAHNTITGQTHAFVLFIPEPETYTMMLAGLGLLGFVARRRKQSVA